MPRKPKPLEVDDDITLEGRITRIGEDRDEHTPVTVRIRGVDTPITLSIKWVTRAD